MGMKANYKKELELAFGDYCKVYDGTDTTSVSHSNIVLLSFLAIKPQVLGNS
jgi:hypothetical protein